MRKILFTFAIVCLIITNIMAQVPQAINFQAIARDASGNVMANTHIQIRLTVIDSATGGNNVYQEVRALQTDAYGSFSFQIGVNPEGFTIGVFENIDWATGQKYLKIDYDPTNFFDWSLTLGTIAFTTVPFAFTANTLTGVITTGANDGDVLKYKSSTGKWEPGTDNTGEIIPVGTILPFAGNVVPTGWMLCNGSAINRTTYSALFTIIGNSWGAGDYTTTFNLPDMRGVFLRGVDGNAGNDPDKATRTAIHAGGNTGNNVGSFQADAFQGHRHGIKSNCSGTGSNPSLGIVLSGNCAFPVDDPSFLDNTYSDNTYGTAKISSESRSKNAYVNYIIKY